MVLYDFCNHLSKLLLLLAFSVSVNHHCSFNLHMWGCKVVFVIQMAYTLVILSYMLDSLIKNVGLNKEFKIIDLYDQLQHFYI